jgi:hemerythrin-like metal-binding protein
MMTDQFVQAIPASIVDSSTERLLPDLPPELQTGHQHLDAEHGLLLNSITNLRRVCIDQVRLRHCGNCDHGRRQHCEGNLVSMLGDLLAFILEHFRTEEAIMRDSLMVMVDRDVCEAHMEDHAAISGKIQEIVMALDRMNTVVLIRELDELLMRWVGNHIALHDILLVRWLERDGASFSHSVPASG